MIQRFWLFSVALLPVALAAGEARAQRAVARVLESQGSVVAATADGKSRAVAVFGTVYAGDRLQVSQGASVVLAFRGNGRIERIKGPAAVTAAETGCTPADRVELVRVAQRHDRPVKDAVEQLPPVTRGGATILKGNSGLPQEPLSPPNYSTVLAVKPTFFWKPLTGVTGYEVKLRDGNAVVWTAKTKETTLVYEGPQPLAEGRRYAWEAIATSGAEVGRAIAAGKFTTATAEQRDVAASLADLTTKQEVPYLVLALLWYQKHGFAAEAIEAGQSLVKQSPRDAAYPWLLADLYDAANRPDEAAATRKRAAELGPKPQRDDRDTPEVIRKLLKPTDR